MLFNVLQTILPVYNINLIERSIPALDVLCIVFNEIYNIASKITPSASPLG